MGDRIAAVTLDDVARVADRYLRPSTCTVGTFEPQLTEAAE
jgi:predicted Zn-dependent peptidase